MIEKDLRNYLKEKLDCDVVLEVKDTMPKEFVFIEKTGSGKENQINSATFAIQSYSTTLFKTAELNEKVKQALEDEDTEVFAMSVSLNSDYNYPDETRKCYRYQAVFDIYY